jgi:hypothetical protein
MVRVEAAAGVAGDATIKSEANALIVVTASRLFEKILFIVSAPSSSTKSLHGL